MSDTEKASSDEQENAWRESFQMFDKNNDGQISQNELGIVIRSVGMNPSEKQLKQMMNEVKKNNNGMIDFEDFKALMKMRNKSCDQEEKDLMCAFRFFDKDQNNYIDGKELQRIMTELGENLSDNEITEMVQVADSNGDGKIDYQEFVKFLLQPV